MTGWTVVTRSKKQRKRTIQIFVKVDGSKITPMDVSLTDDLVEDVIRRIPNGEDEYVTMHGRTLKRSEKLNSCGVSDGCTIQVMSRMRGGGKHKDKKSKVEKKQAASAKTPEQKFVEEVRSDISPVIRECDKDATVTRQESMSDVNQGTQEKNEDNMIHVLDEDSMKSWVDFWSKESDNEVGQRMENWMSVLQGVKEVNVELVLVCCRVPFFTVQKLRGPASTINVVTYWVVSHGCFSTVDQSNQLAISLFFAGV